MPPPFPSPATQKEGERGEKKRRGRRSFIPKLHPHLLLNRLTVGVSQKREKKRKKKKQLSSPLLLPGPSHPIRRGKKRKKRGEEKGEYLSFSTLTLPVEKRGEKEEERGKKKKTCLSTYLYRRVLL